MSKYDSIGTAAELIKEVQLNGLSTDIDDLNRAADIFGRSPVKELVTLANDIGRNNDDGEPDPKGSWSSDRKPTRDTFYLIAKYIWSFEDVTRFWNMHTNPDHEKLKELRDLQGGLKKDLVRLEEELRTRRDEARSEHEARLAETSDKLKAQKEIDRLSAELHDKNMEVMELKAKLYDMMVKEEDK